MENKYNPDIKDKYENLIKDRKIDIKPIENDFKLELNINVKDINKDEIKNNYNKLVESRKLDKKNNVIDNSINLHEFETLKINYNNTYLDLKSNFESNFKKDLNELNVNKQNFNNILDILYENKLL